MSVRPLLLAALALAASLPLQACDEEETRMVAAGQSVTLAPGESAELSGGALRVRFEVVPQDSRCPQGVTCVWEGDASVRLALSGPGQEPSQAELHTNPRFERETSYAGHRVELVGLDPYPKGEAGIPAEAYRATLRFDGDSEAER